MLADCGNGLFVGGRLWKNCENTVRISELILKAGGADKGKYSLRIRIGFKTFRLLIYILYYRGIGIEPPLTRVAFSSSICFSTVTRYPQILEIILCLNCPKSWNYDIYVKYLYAMSIYFLNINGSSVIWT